MDAELLAYVLQLVDDAPTLVLLWYVLIRPELRRCIRELHEKK